MTELGVLTPSPKAVADHAANEGATLNPTDMSEVQRLVLAVKPAKWRSASAPLVDQISLDCTVVSVMAGVTTQALSGVFDSRPVARVMPTTAVSAARGVAAIYADDLSARKVAHALFDAIAETPDLDDEALIDVATAVSGSGVAYAYAFVRALSRAGVRAGLNESQAAALARATVSGAVDKLAAGEPADHLIAEVASPGGTTEAGLSVLEPTLTELVDETVQAALARARQLSA